MKDNKYYGIYQGVVSDVKDPEKRGRIKIKCPDLLGADVESAWCDPCVPVSYDRDFGGDFYVPFLKETVWVMFVGGDVNFPVWIGSWWTEKETVLKDADYKYPKLDDVRVISYRDFKITIHQDECTIENCGAYSKSKVPKNKIILDKDGIHISTDKAIEITAKEDITMSSKANINITAKANVNIKGATINLN